VGGLDATQRGWHAEDEKAHARLWRRYYLRTVVVHLMRVMSGPLTVLEEDEDVARDGNRRAASHQYVRLFWTGHIEVLPCIGVGSQQVELLGCA